MLCTEFLLKISESHRPSNSVEITSPSASQPSQPSQPSKPSKLRIVGDQPLGAPVRGVKRKVMVPEPVLINSAGSGLEAG